MFSSIDLYYQHRVDPVRFFSLIGAACRSAIAAAI
jgi:hypothetical protein